MRSPTTHKSELVIGLSQIGQAYSGKKFTAERFSTFVDYAIDNSINILDSSPGYGEGDWLISTLPSITKQRLIIQSKTLPGLTNQCFEQQGLSVETQILRALRSLNVDAIDTFYINKPNINKISPDVAGVLDQYMDKGLVKKVGVIVHSLSPDLIEYLMNAPQGVYSELNILHNIFHIEAEKELLVLRGKGFAISARSPLSNGIVSSIQNMIASKKSPDDICDPLLRERYLYSLKLLDKFGGKQKLTDLAACFSMSSPYICRTIFGAYKRAHLAQLVSLSNNLLDSRQYKTISGLVGSLSSALKYPTQNPIT